MYSDRSFDEMLDASVVLLSLLLQSSEQRSTFDEHTDLDSSPHSCFGSLDDCAASELATGAGIFKVEFCPSRLIRVSECRPLEFSGLAIPDRLATAKDLTVRSERSGVFVLGVEEEIAFFGSRDPRVGRLDRVLVILKARYGMLCFGSFFHS